MNKIITAIAATSIALTSIGSAAITTYAEYHLGEPGSVTGAQNLPRDSSGNGRNIDFSITGGSGVLTAGVSAEGSTHYMDTATGGGSSWQMFGLLGALSTDNFAFGVYLRAPANDSTHEGMAFLLGSGGPNGFQVGLDTALGGWTAGTSGGGGVDPTYTQIGTSGAFVADEWVHLALVRQSGLTTFYVNKVAQGGTFATAPTFGNLFLGASTGGSQFFDGHLDEARILEFDGADSIDSILAILAPEPAPEPSTLLLGVFGIGILSACRKRK